MAKFFHTQEDKVKAIRLVAAIAQLGKILDEICFTPLRDIQVFAKKFFSTMSGTGEPITTSLLLAGSLATALPYLAKIFNENETTTLQGVLENCEKELDKINDENFSYFDADKTLNALQAVRLKDFFDKDLAQKHAGYLEVEITQKERRRFKNFFRKKQECDIRYKFKDELKAIFHADEALLRHINAESIKDIDAYIAAQKKKQKERENRMDIAFTAEEIAKQKAEELTPEAEALLRQYQRLSDDSQALIKKMIPSNINDKGQETLKPEERTLAHGRKQALSRVEQFQLKDAPYKAYEVANDISFQYWLAFFVFDMVYTQDDATAWNLTAQFIALGAAVVIFAVKLGAKIRDWFKRKNKEKQTEQELKQKADIKYANKALKDKQLTTYFNERLKMSNEERLKNPVYHLRDDVKHNLDNITAQPLPQKSFLKRFKNRFFSIVKTVEEYEELIGDEIAPLDEEPSRGFFAFITDNFFGKRKLIYKELAEEDEWLISAAPSSPEKPVKPQRSTARARASRFLHALNVSSGMGIGFSFIEWVFTVAIAAFDMARTGTKVVADFLNGVGGGVIGILSFVLGTVLGAVYYKTKVKPELDKARKELHTKFNANAGKIAELKQLERENTAMRKFLKANGVALLPTMKIYSDRAYRRKTTQKNTPWTLFKKTVNRVSLFIGKMGTGVLLYRFLPLAILSLAGVAAASAAAVLWPITVAAIVIGAIWGGIYLYQYIQERRLESAKRFIERIDETLDTARQYNQDLRKQFEPMAQPVGKPYDYAAETVYPFEKSATSATKKRTKKRDEEVPLLTASEDQEFDIDRDIKVVGLGSKINPKTEHFPEMWGDFKPESKPPIPHTSNWSPRLFTPPMVAKAIEGATRDIAEHKDSVSLWSTTKTQTQTDTLLPNAKWSTQHFFCGQEATEEVQATIFKPQSPISKA